MTKTSMLMVAVIENRDSGIVEKVSKSCFGLFTLRIPVRQMQLLTPAIWWFRGFSTAPQSPIFSMFLLSCDICLLLQLKQSKTPKFQSKTLTPKNKNKIFPKFLSPSITTTYKHDGHSGKSRRLFSISIDFSLIICYNTHILASRLTKHDRKRSYRPESQATGSADPDS